MTFIKCLLLGFLWTAAYNFIVFAANILHDEPWPPTPNWLFTIGAILYYIAGKPQEALAGYLGPVIDVFDFYATGQILAAFGTIALCWSVVFYYVSKCILFTYRRLW